MTYYHLALGHPSLLQTRRKRTALSLAFVLRGIAEHRRTWRDERRREDLSG